MPEPGRRVDRAAVWLLDHLDFERKPVVEFGLLLAITLLAAWLRLHRLGEWSLWGDEEFTLRFADDGFRAPLSSVLIFWTVRYLGVNEWSGRLMPALIGIATVPVLYLPIRRIFDKSVALVSSLLLAVSTWHVYWSQNVRFYSALLLFFSLALLTFFLAIDEDRPLLIVVSLVFLGLAANERLLALFFVPIAVGYVGLLWILRFERPRGLRLGNLLFYLIPGLIVTAFFAGPYLLSLDDWVVNFGEAGETPLWIVAGIIYYVGLPIVCLGAFGAWHQLLQRGRAGLLLSLAAVTPVLVLVVLAPFQYTVSRYAFVGLTSWILLASLAIVRLIRRANGRDVVLAVGVLALALTTSLSEDFLYFRFQNGNRANARAAFQYIRQQQSAGDAVVAANADLGRYYLGAAVRRLDLYDFAAIPPDIKRIWIIDDMSLVTTIPQQYAWIRTHAHEVANFDVHINARNFVMRVYLYNVPSKTDN